MLCSRMRSTQWTVWKFVKLSNHVQAGVFGCWLIQRTGRLFFAQVKGDFRPLHLIHLFWSGFWCEIEAISLHNQALLKSTNRVVGAECWAKMLMSLLRWLSLGTRKEMSSWCSEESFDFTDNLVQISLQFHCWGTCGYRAKALWRSQRACVLKVRLLCESFSGRLLWGWDKNHRAIRAACWDLSVFCALAIHQQAERLLQAKGRNVNSRTGCSCGSQHSSSQEDLEFRRSLQSKEAVMHVVSQEEQRCANLEAGVALCVDRYLTSTWAEGSHYDFSH